MIDALRLEFAALPAGALQYRRLRLALDRAIAGSEGGAVLPGERVIAEALSVSRVTVRRALALLEADGVVSRRQGARTEVSARVEKALPALTGFSEDLRARGLEPGCIWLWRQVVRASPAEAMALALGAEATVLRMRRVRTADGAPIAIEQAAVPTDFLPSPDLVGDSLYEALAARGFQPQRALQRMRAEAATAAEARLLRCAEGAPILFTERRCFLADDRPVEHCETRYRGDVYEFLLELRR
ncbi:MAG: GntR family transcriptional regulator [Amaricoccus sp.]